jgi:hypothetical protein
MYRKVDFDWVFRTREFVFFGLLVIADCFLRSTPKHKPKSFNFMDFVNPLKDLRIILVSMTCFMIFLMVFFPGNSIVLDALHRGMSGRLAFYLLVVLNAVMQASYTRVFLRAQLICLISATGNISAGNVADTIGRFNCMIIVNILSAIFVLGFSIPSKTNAELFVFY